MSRKNGDHLMQKELVDLLKIIMDSILNADAGEKYDNISCSVFNVTQETRTVTLGEWREERPTGWINVDFNVRFHVGEELPQEEKKRSVFKPFEGYFYGSKE